MTHSTQTTNSNSDRSQPPRSPKAVLSTSREEFYGQDPQHQPLELIVQERRTEEECPNYSPEDLFSDKCWKLSQLPADLYGHVFIVGAVGCFDSPQCEGSDCVVEPAKGGYNSLINGEGMIYRLDFHQCPQIPTAEAGKAWMVTRIVKTPDHYADLAVGKDGDENKYKQKWPNEYGLLKFNNYFLSRLSLKLGARNYLNTAFLPMKFSDGTERLLVTWDAGRPYEVDPQTLGLVGPIGWNWQWHPICSLLPQHVFPITLSAAHAVFDTHSDEMFTVNAIKSLRTVLSVSRILTFSTHNLSGIIDNKPYLKLWLKKIFTIFMTWIKCFFTYYKEDLNY